MTTFWNNDYARAFFKDHGYPEQYNDGMFAWLKDVYGVTNSTLPDLLARYLKEYGDDFNMRVLGKSAVSVGYITPAATFTATTPSSASGGAETLLTSAGAHGLTSAVAVGKHLYIASGTGWSTGFYEITAIAVDTTGTTVQIDVPYDAGMGTPDIALEGTEVTFATLTIPPLRTDSCIKVDGTWSFKGSTVTKNAMVRLDGSLFFGAGTTNASHINLRPSSIIIQNRGATNSQIGAIGGVGLAAQNGVGTAPVTTGTVDTSVSTILTLGGLLTAADEFIYLERYIVQVYL